MARSVVVGEDGRARCWWCIGSADYARYHDHDWGWPVRDDAALFEALSLEAFQSGLSWLTILRKRENFRAAFAGFDPARVARFNTRSVERLLRDPGIVRHRGKIEATIHNARRLRELVDEFGSFAAYVWRFQPPAPARPRRVTRARLLAGGLPQEATALSRDLRRRGWRHFGPTTAHSFMQAVGLLNDHLDGCWVRPRITAARVGGRSTL